MPTNNPQYYRNELDPLRIDKGTLLNILKELQSAVIHGTQLIQSNCHVPNIPNYGSIFSGTPGVVLAFLRLGRQTPCLAGNHELKLPNFQGLAQERIILTPMQISLAPGRMSPIASSPVGAAVVRILAACEIHDTSAKATGSHVFKSDVAMLRDVIDAELKHGHTINYRDHIMGGDEVLYGRAGLLWATLNIRHRIRHDETRDVLKLVLEDIPKLIDAIIESGKQGALDFAKQYGEKEAFPLMWLWMENYYGLGAVHGISGILTILLQCEIEELDDGAARTYLPLISGTITSLCRICIANNGHLPTAIPPMSSSRPSHLVQLCHGSPGLLVLLATARRHASLSTYWQPEWDEAIYLGTERVWEEGLLSKGGSLCHGLTGNAWPLLMLHDSFEYAKDLYSVKRTTMENTTVPTKRNSSNISSETLSSDYFLSRALAFLRLAQECPPYSTDLGIKPSYHFRMPDRPYGLYEGLAGMVCAWAEACAVIQARLRKMEIDGAGEEAANKLMDDEIFESYMLQQLGVPGLGGQGPNGLL